MLTSSTQQIDPELLILRRQQLSIRELRVKLLKHDGLPFYKPFPKQAAFHAAGAKFKRRMVRSGNRFGKSYMGCAEDCAWMRRERVWLPKDDPNRTAGIPQHPIKLLTITTDWDKVDEIWTSQRGDSGKVWRFLPKDGFIKSVSRNHSGAIDTIEATNGSLWRFDTVKSWMANPQGSESSDWDAIHVDEPCPEGMWKAASRGLIDRNGSAWFTLTPLKEFWINDYFFPEDTGGKTRDNVWAINGSTYDNPYLSPDAIKEFESTLKPDEIECRIRGLPLHLSGLIYKQFGWEKHVLQTVPKGWSSFYEPPLDYPIYYAIDPHPQTPHAVLFVTVLPTGQRVYLQDIFDHCSVEQLASQINAVLKGRFLVWGKIDPLAYINDPITETNMAEEFSKYGLYPDKATKALAQGILRVQGELTKNQILFSPACRRTLWEIQRYAWDEKENKPIDKDDHMMENLYRLELSEPTFIEPEKNKKLSMKELEISVPEVEMADMSLD